MTFPPVQNKMEIGVILPKSNPRLKWTAASELVAAATPVASYLHN